MISIVNILLFIYLIIIVLSVIGWTNSSKVTLNSKNNDNILISVIVPFRNEEKKILQTVNSVLSQEKAGDFELILVNDHSEDKSVQLIEQLVRSDKRIQIIHLEGETGKKAAIKAAVQQSSGDIILQTDADCIHTPRWISCMRETFSDKYKLLLGPITVLKEGKKWEWFNQLEISMLQIFTAAVIHFKKPTMANGANLMYRKEDYLAYLKSGLGAGKASGDDQYLLNYITSINPELIAYNKHPDAIVKTDFPSEWNDMIEQRSRWALKNTDSKGLEFTLGMPFLFVQLLVPVLLVFSVINPHYEELTLDLILSKIFLEFVLFFVAESFFKVGKLRYVPLFSILYPLFIINVLFSMRKNNATWKGRKI